MPALPDDPAERAEPMFRFVSALMKRTRFEPFVIKMDDGEEIEIDNREFILPIPGFELILVHRPQEKERLLDPGHISQLRRPAPVGGAITPS